MVFLAEMEPENNQNGNNLPQWRSASDKASYDHSNTASLLEPTKQKGIRVVLLLGIKKERFKAEETARLAGDYASEKRKLSKQSMGCRKAALALVVMVVMLWFGADRALSPQVPVDPLLVLIQRLP